MNTRFAVTGTSGTNGKSLTHLKHLATLANLAFSAGKNSGKSGSGGITSGADGTCAGIYLTENLDRIDLFDPFAQPINASDEVYGDGGGI